MPADDGTSLTALLNPLTPLRLGLRALDDLHAVASVAREEPNPQVALRDALESAREDLGRLLEAVEELVGGVREITHVAQTLDRHAVELDGTAREIVTGGRELTDTAKTLDGTAREIDAGGRELTDTARALDGTAGEIVTGGRDLTETAKELDSHMERLLGFVRVLERHLPQAIRALGAVESLEDSVETVAETVEPLADTAERVGRLTRRLPGGGNSS